MQLEVLYFQELLMEIHVAKQVLSATDWWARGFVQQQIGGPEAWYLSSISSAWGAAEMALVRLRSSLGLCGAGVQVGFSACSEQADLQGRLHLRCA